MSWGVPSVVWAEPVVGVGAPGDQPLDAPPWVDQTDWGTPPTCRPGSHREGRKCVPEFTCPEGFERNDKTGWCDPEDREGYCGKDAFYVPSKGACVEKPCKRPLEFDIRTGKCVNLKTGQPCCPGQDPDWPCFSDRVWDEQGNCVSRKSPHCPKLYGPLSTYDADSGKCTCPVGYSRSEVEHTCIPNTVNPEYEAAEREDLILPAVGGAAVGGLLVGAWRWWVRRRARGRAAASASTTALTPAPAPGRPRSPARPPPRRPAFPRPTEPPTEENP